MSKRFCEIQSAAGIFAIVGMFGLAVTNGANAQGYFSDWASAKPPGSPELKAVKIDPKKSALLILDFGANCGENARCAAALPKIEKLLTQARANGMAVVYTHTRNQKPGDVPAQIAPAPGEQDLDARAKPEGLQDTMGHHEYRKAQYERPAPGVRLPEHTPASLSPARSATRSGLASLTRMELRREAR